MTMQSYDIQWQGIDIVVRHTPDYFRGMDHIEVESENLAVLPITETGYRSHFMRSEEVKTCGGPVSFVRQWLDEEGKTKQWLNYVEISRQYSLTI